MRNFPAIAAALLWLGLTTTPAAVPAPATPYQWRNVAIGAGGFVTGLIFHPRAKDLLYARTDVGGAYRWEESGQHWIPITDSFSSADFTGIESIALDPNDTNRVYLAAGIYESTKSAIFRSDDQGKTWRRTEVPFKMGGNEPGRFNGERLLVDPQDGQTLFFGSRRDGLWKSTDGNKTWTRVEGFPAVAPEIPAANLGRRYRTRPVGIICVLSDHGMMYAAVSTAGTNFFQSADSGVHWEAVPSQPLGLRPNHVVPASDGILYLSYGREAGPSAMTDGAVWKFDRKNAAWSNITPVASPDDGQPFGYGAVTVDAENPKVILASTFCRWKQHDDIFRSTNSGATWAPLFTKATWNFSNAPYTHSIQPHWIGSITISPFDSSRVWFTTGYGVWRCDNLTDADSGVPLQWNFSDRGLEETVPLALASPPVGAQLLSGVGDIDGFRHDDLDRPPSGGSFSGPHYGNTEGIAYAAGSPQIVVRVGTGRSRVHAAISQDGGKNWEPLAGDAVPGEAGGAVAIASDAKTIVWTTRQSVAHFTADRGAAWNVCSGLAPGIRVVADQVNASIFYAFDARAGRLFISTNGAANFIATPFNFAPAENVRSGMGFDIPSGADLMPLPGREGDLWLSFGNNGLWHSTNGGFNFEKSAKVDAVLAFGSGKPLPGADSPALYLFGTVESQAGVFRSDDSGQTWVLINDAEHQFGWIAKLTGDPKVYGRVYLATSGRGIIYGEPHLPTK